MKKRTVVSLGVAFVIALVWASFQTGFCEYRPLLPKSVEFQDGFRVWDHSRRIECPLGLSDLVYVPLGGAK